MGHHFSLREGSDACQELDQEPPAQRQSLQSQWLPSLPVPHALPTPLPQLLSGGSWVADPALSTGDRVPMSAQSRGSHPPQGCPGAPGQAWDLELQEPLGIAPTPPRAVSRGRQGAPPGHHLSPQPDCQEPEPTSACCLAGSHSPVRRTQRVKRAMVRAMTATANSQPSSRRWPWAPSRHSQAKVAASGQLNRMPSV